MSSKGRKRWGGGPPFVQLHHWLLQSPAWLDLSPNDRCVYIAIKARFDGGNNGTISFGAREAGLAIGASHHTGNRSLLSLQEHGFIVITEESSFNRKTREARQYLLTELPDDRAGMARIATKSFMNWRPEIQNTVSPVLATVSRARPKRVNHA